MKLTVTHILLFIATVLTTFLSGYLQGGSIASGVYFSFSIMLILGAHEFGHYMYARRHNVVVSPPYFIPVPPLFIAGTMGAFIKIKSQIRSKRSLFDIGVAGPLFGIIATLPILFIGLKMSQIVPLTEFDSGPVIRLGSSLLFEFFVKLTLGSEPLKEGYDIMLHPMAFAGWLGLFITAINLIPSGQLDGGHLIFSLFSKKVHSFFSHASIAVLVILGMGSQPFVNLLQTLGLDVENLIKDFTLEGWFGWLIWVFALVVIGTGHPPTTYEEKDIGGKRKLLGLLTLLVFIGCFMPVPFVTK